MSGMDVLRERIARALWKHAGVRYFEGQLFCTCGLRLWHPETGFYSDRVKKQIGQPLGEAAQSQHHADAVIAELGPVAVYGAQQDEDIVWGWEPDVATVRREWPGLPVVRSYVTPWERIEEGK